MCFLYQKILISCRLLCICCVECRFACSSLIYPLSWECFLTPVMDENNETLVGYPFPGIIGVYASEEKKWELLKNSQHGMVVLLDTGEILQYENIVATVFPTLTNSNIRNLYKPFERSFYESIQPTVVNEPSKELVDAAEQICKEVEAILKEVVFDKLPRKEELKGKVTLDSLYSIIESRTEGENKSFVEKMIRTQMFVEYLFKHYDL
eukprot:TRINITY_DN12238_c0_g1_i4.p1 TRINITY_DN12238_c0_g1~~TRINITY_DN12238_c0_g1_i4.p1  ORF type:complete len:208 (+),score=12.64 TRINITY_DN12238_c0_g1_i4:451-1074(+)